MRRIRWFMVVAGLSVVGGIVAGYALLHPPSPTTTVTDASGREAVLDWAHFPGEPYLEPAAVLAAPRAEAIEREGDALLDDLQLAVDAAASGLDWQVGLEGGIHEHDGNGYGGPTMHRTFNSAERSTGDIPDDWRALTAALDAELVGQGFAPIEWEFDREPFPHQTAAERDAEVVAMHGSLDPDEMWTWLGSASNGSMWVSVVLSDVDRGVGAPPDGEQRSPRGLSLMAGATVIAVGDEQAYRDGTAPFDGLERPATTHSD